VGEDERALLSEMVKTMRINRGIGLAAPQVGINKRVAVIDIGDKKLLQMVNPVVLQTKGSDSMEEGCLSIPNTYVNVKRAKWVQVEYLDEHGKKQVLEAEGLLARAILHEIDHLKGRLIADYLNPLVKFFVLRKLKR
jgi:peptide deformylase